jgi:hypothetical protein
LQDEGHYTVEQISLSYFKLDVALRNGIGPYAKGKKPPYNGDDRAITCRKSDGQVSGGRWAPSPCPIYESTSPKMLTRDDLLSVLTRLPFSKNSTGHTAKLEDCIVRSKLGASLFPLPSKVSTNEIETSYDVKYEDGDD